MAKQTGDLELKKNYPKKPSKMSYFISIKKTYKLEKNSEITCSFNIIYISVIVFQKVFIFLKK